VRVRHHLRWLPPTWSTRVSRRPALISRGLAALSRICRRRAEIVTRGGVKYEHHAESAVERRKIDLVEAFLQQAVAHEDHSEDQPRVEVDAGEQAQFVQHVAADVCGEAALGARCSTRQPSCRSGAWPVRPRSARRARKDST
jgi:hypothetical protein